MMQQLQSAVDTMCTSLDAQQLMPLRKKAFLECAKCTELGSREAYGACVQRAQIPEQYAQQTLQRELNEFQDRIRRAALACQDEVKDRGFTDQDRMRTAYDKCLDASLQKHVKMLPDLKKRLVTSMQMPKQ